MKKSLRVGKARVLVGVLLTAFVSVLIFLYWWLGFKYVVDVKSTVDALSDNDKEWALRTLAMNQTGTNFFKGVLLRPIGTKSLKGILVWNYDGLKYYKVSPDVVFNTFSICEDRKWERASGEVKKSANMNYEEWKRKIQRGDYIEVILTNEGYIQNISAYDWWAFAPTFPFSYFELTCKNR